MEAVTVLGGNSEVMSRRGEGHGRRLTSAFEALDAFPALAESRTRLLRVVRDEQVSMSEVVGIVESDVALAAAIMRLANRARPGEVSTVVEAVEVLTPTGVKDLADEVEIYNFFESTPAWNSQPEQFRLHAVTVRKAAQRIAGEIGYDKTDELIAMALLHDIGKLVLVKSYPGYPNQVLGSDGTPEERIHIERRELGMDHAMVGGVLARRWGLPNSVATVIEKHHAEDATGEAAIVQLADLIAHYEHEQPVAPESILRTAKQIGLKGPALREMLYEIPLGSKNQERSIEICPLSNRELEILKGLASGKVYKQIAMDLGLSTSTVRTHLHNVYGKMGAVDRAQAVLLASQRGWI